jgi:hypothetical protein
MRQEKFSSSAKATNESLTDGETITINQFDSDSGAIWSPSAVNCNSRGLTATPEPLIDIWRDRNIGR